MAGTVTSKLSYRPALDGLRAIAVIGVMVYHLDSRWLPGGFLGVDMFFVLSGFLITSLLLLETRQTGSLDLGRFFTRRIRRLLPASLLVLFAVIAVTWIVGNPLDQAGRRPEIVSALLYVANWQFVASGQSYFETFIDISPIRHYWSLAIEEQFYLFWPFAFLGLTKLSKKSLTWAGPALIAIVSAVAMASTFDASDPSRSYFGTDSRIHQLLVGCVLAIAVAGGAGEKIKAFARRLLPYATAVMILALFLISDTNVGYYVGGAAAFGLIVASVIGGLETPSQIGNLLSWKPLVWIGGISYGLYLWHWPIIQWVDRDLVGQGGLALAVIQVSLTFAAATASFYLVEKPIRAGNWLGVSIDRRTLKRLVPAATSATVLLAFLALSSPVPEWMQTPTAPASVLLPIDPVARPEIQESAEKHLTVGTVGDSVMVSMLPGLRDLAAANNWKLSEGSIQACPLGYKPLYDDEGTISPYFESICKDGVPAAVEQVLMSAPDLILWHDLQSVLNRRDESGALLVSGTDGWLEDLVAEWTLMLDRLSYEGAQVVFITPPLRSQDAPCPASNTRCLVIAEQDRNIRWASQVFLERNLGNPRLHALSVDHLVCPDGYPCPAMIDGIEIRLGGNDQTHFTEEGSEWLASHLQTFIASISSEPSA